MTRSKQLLANACFLLLFLVGGTVTLVGFFVVPARPHFLLDVVLTPEELADVSKRDETLAMLKRIPHRTTPTVTTGIVIMALSALGAWTTRVTEVQRT